MAAAARIITCHRCHGIFNPKSEVARWIVATIDGNGRITFDRPANNHRFIEAMQQHGALAFCGNRCARGHLDRWLWDQITALDNPACASPAVADGDCFTAWVSDVYKTTTQFGPARIVNYMDMGRRFPLFCFKQHAFEQVDLAGGHHVTFRIEHKQKDDMVYTNIVDVVEVDGEPIALFIARLRSAEVLA